MKRLTQLAVERPVMIVVIILALVILGAQGYSALKVDRYPGIVIPFASVSVSWAGAVPEDVEQYITKPIEDAVSGISGVDTIQSTASEGLSVTSIQFLQNVDSNQAATDVERALGRIKSQLPTDATDPSISKADPNAVPIMNIALSGPQSLADLYYAAVNNIQPRLLALPGVAVAQVTGGLVEEIQVQIDPQKLSAYGLSLSQVQQALTAENADVPAGAVTTNQSYIAIRSLGQFANVQDIQSLVVTTQPTLVRVQDVANVVDTYQDVTQIVRLNGQSTVGLSITQQPDANVIQVADAVRAALNKMQAQHILPQGAQFTIVTDDSQFTRDSVDSVRTDLLLAVLITGLVLLLFLHNLRSTVIVLLAVPTSMISTFLIMFALGFSLDTVSLMALALTIGILVDDSIVVLENIIRHLGLGEAPQEAAINGRGEIGMAALAITLTDVVVYVPVAFMSGIIGQLFREYGITIATATLFSLFVSFTLTPMLASRWFKGGEEHPAGVWAWFVRAWEWGFNGLVDFYGRTLQWSLGRRPLVLFVAGAALAVSLAFLPLHLLGVEYTPSEDDGVFTTDVLMPYGTPLATTDAAVQQFEKIATSMPEVTDVMATIGDSSTSAASSAGPAGATITVKLMDKRQRTRSVFQVIDDIRQKVTSIKNASFQFTTTAFIGVASGAALQVQLTGPDETTLVGLAKQIAGVMGSVPGVTDVRNTDALQSPQLAAQLDRARMNDLGISAAEVGAALRTTVSGSLAGTYQRPGLADLNITLIAAPAARNDPNVLAQMPLKFTNTGTAITLGDIGQLTPSQAPGQIERFNRERTLSLSASASGRSAGDVAADIQKAINQQVKLPQDYVVQMLGQEQQQNTAFGALFGALTLSVVLIYLLMAALYESFMEPLVIMFSLPVSLVGAFGGLYLTGNTLNIFSLLGIIMLMGLVTKNAILLVDFADILRKRGYDRGQALVEAGRLRLRPILMTTASVVFAMIPFVLKLEPGAESRAPLAAAVMGGVISSTLLTLVLIPTAYTYIDNFEAFVRRNVFHMEPRWAEEPLPEPAADDEPPAGYDYDGYVQPQSEPSGGE